MLSLQPKQLTSKEVRVYIKLLKHAIVSLDVFMIGRTKNRLNYLSHHSPAPSLLIILIFSSNNFNKEEKDTIESLGLIFSLLHPISLREVLSLTIDFIIERTFKNINIAIISSYFLATPATSYIYATILIEYLINKMELMGCKCFFFKTNKR